MEPWKQNISVATGVLLCLSALCFPFSVAATNSALALALVTGLLSSQLKQGALLLWQQQRTLTLALLVYLALVLAGISWSLDRNYGLEVAGHLWLWLLLPLILAALQERRWQSRFLTSLSVGLSLHLLLCLLQKLAIIEASLAVGSDIYDPTGYIGHISFGIVYGIWGGWLLHIGWLGQGWRRWLPWLLSISAFSMIFMAQGRSGYLVAAAVLLLVFWKHLVSGQSIKRIMTGMLVLIALAVLVVTGPGKERVEKTTATVQAVLQGDMSRVEARWLIWLEAIEVWKQHPLLGVGTGGYFTGVHNLRSQSTTHPHYEKVYSHAHSMYLHALVRWGPLGLGIICALFYFWIRSGMKTDWSTISGESLVILSGTALTIHGLSSVSLEEHFATIMAIFSLGAGLAFRSKISNNSN